jgi:hypothetical protein
VKKLLVIAAAAIGIGIAYKAMLNDLEVPAPDRTPAVGQSGKIMHYMPACRGPDTLDRFSYVMRSGDKEAMNQFLSSSVVTGECRMIKPGETVSVEGSTDLSVQVRRKGWITAYWVSRHAFDQVTD